MPGPPRPNPHGVIVAMLAYRSDPPRQHRTLRDHRQKIVARAEYLDHVATAFRFDHPLDAGLPPDVRRGIEKRLARVRELAAEVRGWAAAGRWPEAEERYEQAERLAVDADHWVARGRAAPLV